MGVEAVALTDFVHNDIDARFNKLCRHSDGSLIDEFTARDLEANGLVRIRMNPVVAKQPGANPAGKASDDGAGQPSSASPAAPRSTTLTSDSLKPGASRIRKSDG